MLITLLSLPNSVGVNSMQSGREMKLAKLTMRVRRTFAVDTPKGIDQVVSDNPTYVSFEINHKNGRNFKIIGKAIAPVFKKIF